MAFIIGGVRIKNPSTFKIERYNVTDMQRLANAQMVGDLIAQKRKFYFTYEAITATELERILDHIWYSKKLFFTLSYEENGVAKSAEVYVGSIPTSLHRAGRGNNWVWKDVTFNLIER